MTISQPSSALVIRSYAKATHFLHASQTWSLFLYSTVRPIFCRCLHRQCLKWKLRRPRWLHWWPPLQNWTLQFLVATKNSNPSAELTTNNMLFKYFPVKVQAEPNTCIFHVMCFRDLRISKTTERIVSENFAVAMAQPSQRQPATKSVCKTRGCNYSFWAPDDGRCVALNMLSN
jgi:hypothetical protein